MNHFSSPLFKKLLPEILDTITDFTLAISNYLASSELIAAKPS